MLSASSVAVCLFMNVKTSHLERKVELLEMERLSVIQPVHATLDAHATLWDAIEKLVQEVSEEIIRAQALKGRRPYCFPKDYFSLLLLL